MSDLKPCPFCGGEAVHCRTAKAYHVYCSNCGADVMRSTLSAMTTSQINRIKIEAFEKWNTRAGGVQPTTITKQRDELVKLFEGLERVTDIWLPSHVDNEHIGEAECLHRFRNEYLALLSEIDKQKSSN